MLIAVLMASPLASPLASPPLLLPAWESAIPRSVVRLANPAMLLRDKNFSLLFYEEGSSHITMNIYYTQVWSVKKLSTYKRMSHFVHFYNQYLYPFIAHYTSQFLIPLPITVTPAGHCTLTPIDSVCIGSVDFHGQQTDL